MALSINTNIASLNAQRNLGKTQGALNKSLQRLSSGLRINSAKDDAAGLAISNRMASQVRGLNQAVRNANDAISLSQTAEGALQESTSILQRMRELSVQSANDTNTASDRSSMQAEITQLLAELDRIAETTQFNGKNLLDGSMIDATFHVGANAGDNQSISFNISSAQTEELSSVGTTISAPNGTAVSGTSITGALAAGGLNVNGNAIGETTNDAVSLAAAISAADSDVTATATNVQTIDFSNVTLASNAATHDGTAVTGDLEAGELTINTVDVGVVAQDAVAIAAAIETADSNVTATAADSTSGAMNAFTTTADGTYSLSVEDVVLFDAVAAGVTASDVQDAINAADWVAAGVTVGGTVAGDDLTFTKADGSTLDIV